MTGLYFLFLEVGFDAPKNNQYWELFPISLDAYVIICTEFQGNLLLKFFLKTGWQFSVADSFFLEVFMMNKHIRYAKSFFKSLLPVVLLGVMVNSPALAYDYDYELIGPNPNVEPKAINYTGVVVGASNTDQYPTEAFRWSSGDYDVTPILDGGISANAVNDAEQIAGSTIDGAFIDNRDWSDYGAFGINQTGEVAGYKVGKNPYQPRSLPYNPAVFDGKKWNVFDIARLYPRGTRQGVYADRFILNSINDGGYAVGYKYRYGLAGSAAILIDTNGPVNDASDVVYLATPYGGRAVDINNNRMIVGTTGSNSSTGEYAYAFLYNYDVNTLINLGTLPVDGPGSEPGLTSSAYDINESNQVVGSSRLITANTSLNDPTKYHAFLWEPPEVDPLEAGTMTDLNDRVKLPEGTILTRATAINDKGDIAAVGLVYGIEHGFLLTPNGATSEPQPTPEPPEATAIKGKGKGKRK